MSALGPISADALCARTFVRHVEIHDELPSTNDRAMQLTLFAELETPALIVARRQLAGRGRGTHAWWSADGALTFSLIIEPASWGIVPGDWPKLSLTTAVAVCDALEAESGVSCSIKWPNDVLTGGAKVSGILIESPGGSAPAKDRVVIGVGINVNNSWAAAPHEAGGNGTTLRDAYGRDLNSQAIMIEFLNSLNRGLRQLAHSDPELPRAWQQRSWLDDQHVEVDSHGRTVGGDCMGIAVDGALVVQTLFGEQRVFAGTVRIVES
jgi:BirA family biotin operon repressor/biotin-[acetyl-CoA-carboxylase] ligase